MTALDSRVTLTLGVVRFAMAVAAPTAVVFWRRAMSSSAHTTSSAARTRIRIVRKDADM